jgi:hypothetical protein
MAYGQMQGDDVANRGTGSGETDNAVGMGTTSNTADRTEGDETMRISTSNTAARVAMTAVATTASAGTRIAASALLSQVALLPEDHEHDLSLFPRDARDVNAQQVCRNGSCVHADVESVVGDVNVAVYAEDAAVNAVTVARSANAQQLGDET